MGIDGLSARYLIPKSGKSGRLSRLLGLPKPTTLEFQTAASESNDSSTGTCFPRPQQYAPDMQGASGVFWFYGFINLGGRPWKSFFRLSGVFVGVQCRIVSLSGLLGVI